MMSRVVFALIKPLLAFVFLGSVNVAYCKTPVSSDMKVSWVGEEVTHNGFPMQIQQFHSSNSAEAVLSFYRSQWVESVGEGMPGFVENQVGEWRTISRLESGKNTVIQLKASHKGGVEGYISVMDTAGTGEVNKITSSFPKMSDTELISSTESTDSGVKATTIILKNTHSISSNSDFYVSSMKNQNFSLAHQSKDEGTKVLFFNGRGFRVEITISPSNDGSSLILANISKV